MMKNYWSLVNIICGPVEINISLNSLLHNTLQVKEMLENQAPKGKIWKIFQIKMGFGKEHWYLNALNPCKGEKEKQPVSTSRHSA